MLHSQHSQWRKHFEHMKASLGHMGLLFLWGDSGSGKTHTLRQLHQSLSPGEPLVEWDCQQMSVDLFVDRLFGHVKGAFSGAHRDVMGLVGEARKGTLLCEGVDNLSLEQQSSLLRFLEDRDYRPVGDIATTHFKGRLAFTAQKSLSTLAAEGVLRADFAYRLGISEFRQPSWWERPKDISDLMATVWHDLQVQLEVFAPLPKDLREDVLYSAAQAHGLKHHLTRRLLGLPEPEAPESLPETAIWALLPDEGDLKSDMALLEQWLLRRALWRHPNKTKAAKALGLSRRALYYKIDKAGVVGSPGEQLGLDSEDASS